MTVLITVNNLRRFAPRCNAAAIAPGLQAAAEEAEIDTPRRVRHFMAHLHHESMGFIRLEENLRYSTPERLMKVWRKRFPTRASAMPYVNNPKALAEKVYFGRMGNVRPGDGWKYRGGGWIMLTFFNNYKAAEAWCGLPLAAQPELARTPGPASQIAARFWQVNGLNKIVDKDDDEKIVSTISQQIKVNESDDLLEGTEEINGGRTGLADRGFLLDRAAQIWA